MWINIVGYIGIAIIFASFLFKKTIHFKISNLIGVETLLFFLLLKQILPPVVMFIFLVVVTALYTISLKSDLDEVLKHKKVKKPVEEKSENCKMYRDEDGYDVIIIGDDSY